MEIKIDTVDILKDLPADSRGRVCLGLGYADKLVTVAVVETEERYG